MGCAIAFLPNAVFAILLVTDLMYKLNRSLLKLQVNYYSHRLGAVQTVTYIQVGRRARFVLTCAL